GSHTFNPDFHYIAGLDRSHAFRCSGGYQIPGKKGHDVRDIANHNIQGKNEIARVALLAKYTVDRGFNRHASPRIDLIRYYRSNGAKCIEPFGPGPLIIFVLQIARGEIVHAGVAENVRTHIFFWRKLVTSLGDHDSKFAFIIGLLGNARSADDSAWSQQGTRGLQKDQGLGRDFVAQFVRVLTVIAANT